MPYTNNIVSYINDWLIEGTLKNFKPVKTDTIVNPVLRVESGTEATFPGFHNKDGEIEAVTPDDLFNIQIYHKLNGNIYSTEKRGSVSDSYDIVSVSELSLFVFAFSDKVNMTADQLEPLFIFGMPGSISNLLARETYIKKCTITPLSSDMDKMRNFRNEYSGIQNFLQPEHIFFSIRYTIRKVFDKNCIDACISCREQKLY